LKRRDFPEEVIEILKEAYRTIFRSGMNTEEALASLEPMADKYPEIAELIRFIGSSERGIIRA
jgi:UDP-N-acetylglucosamine acyltransferase